MELFYLLGGFALGLIYSAGTMPATVWVVQVALRDGVKAGLVMTLALSLSQWVWVLIVSQLVLNSEQPFVMLDPYLRVLFPLFFFWMAYIVKQSTPLSQLHLVPAVKSTAGSVFKNAFFMPWRFVFWLGLFVSISIHLKAPGFVAAFLCSLGALAGMLLWNLYFVFLAGIFGHRVPEPITLRSVNKLRLLSFTVFLGLGILIAAPLVMY